MGLAKSDEALIWQIVKSLHNVLHSKLHQYEVVEDYIQLDVNLFKVNDV